MTNHFPCTCSRLIQQAGKLARVVIWFACVAVAQQAERQEAITLHDLVPRADPLAVHDLRFDPTFARTALQYLRSQNPDLLDQLAKSPAATHLLNHARNFDYDVPKDSASALVSHLLQPPSEHAGEIQTCERSLVFFSGPMLDGPHWVADTLRYLPDDFRFHGSLFLTFGYDIGVAINNTASLNCAHPHFRDNPRELLYYAIHELHHVGFMTYQPPPRLSDLKTCADLLRLVQYSTQLEGMAVLAAYQRRHDEHAAADDPDYIALEGAQTLQREESLYFDDFNYLKRRGSEPADSAAWAVIDRMSSGERLWYRVGAKMALKIEKVRGRFVLLELVKKGPADFLQTYQSLAPTAAN